MTLRELINIIQTTCPDSDNTVEQLMDREIRFDVNGNQFEPTDALMYNDAFGGEDYINVGLEQTSWLCS